MDELDNANAKMDEYAKVKPDEKAELADDGAKIDPLRASKEWWNSVRSLNSEKVSPSIVNCRLGNSSQFMTRDQCLSRGGNPDRISG